MLQIIQDVQYKIEEQELTIESLQLDTKNIINNLSILIESVNILKRFVRMDGPCCK